MKVVHSSQLYKRSKLRYKPTTLSLCVNEQEETELRYCRTGCRERVVPWHKVLGVHVLADTCALEFHTKHKMIVFRAHLAADIDQWTSCLPQVMPSSERESAALSGRASAGEPSSPRRGSQGKGARWVLGMGYTPTDFATAIDTLGAKMTPVTRAPRAPAGGGGGNQSTGDEAQGPEPEQPAQAGGHAGAVRCGAAGTIFKDSIQAEAQFYEETAPQLVEIGG